MYLLGYNDRDCRACARCVCLLKRILYDVTGLYANVSMGSRQDQIMVAHETMAGVPLQGADGCLLVLQ
jgi:hypothetical protein